MQVVRDRTHERHSLQCGSCGETERRFVFARESVLAEPVPIPGWRLPSVPPPLGTWARAVAKLRAWQFG